MKNNTIQLLLSLLFISLLTTASAQENKRTITVSGTSEFNLSPNEIIVKISFQEYFTDEAEKSEHKIKIESLEKKVLDAIQKTGLKKDKITSGSVQVIRPYKHGIYYKPRLNKSLFVCVNNTQQYVDLTRMLETDGLFEKAITTFSITQYRHTEKEAYLTKSRNLAYNDAINKAKLILSNSNNQVGQVIRVTEVNKSVSTSSTGSFYTTENATTSSSSGFRPIVISYDLEVVFEILKQ